ncbi:MCE family protein [Pseudonocardia sp. CA-107938]|uniref:MCE family protein n=1 Tax=Pseudonocardia sp. CA-107938 TaxID=3240021 RepID=UPI003D8B8FF0
MRNNKLVLQGLAFVAVVALLIGLAVAQYAGAFRSGVPVMLKATTAGSQLNPRADVKVRGLIVGRVDSITSTGNGADILMSIDPDKIGQIPSNVTARLLPKTLFGEKFVSLEPPAAPSTTHLVAGDVIGQDRSSTAVEVDTALDDLEPVLTAVQPEKLKAALGGIAMGLEGRGEQLGQTLVGLNVLVEGITPSVPALSDDLRDLAKFSDTAADTAPELLSALDDLTVPANTIVDQADNLRDVYSSVIGASDDLRAFLDENGENIIQLVATSRPTLETLAFYAPEFPCFFGNLVSVIPRGEEVFGAPGSVNAGKPGIHVTIELPTNPKRGKYKYPDDLPEFSDNRGPRCYPQELPAPYDKGNFPQYAPDGPFRDGTVPPPGQPNQPKGNPENYGIDTYGTYDPSKDSWGLVKDPGPLAGTPLANFLASPASVDMGLPNSPGEQAVVTSLIGAQQGRPASSVPGWSTFLVGPLYRGSEVTMT